jgi:apolipoprotein N-acyltransferase
MWAVLRWASVVGQVFFPLAWALLLTAPMLAGSSESRRQALPGLILIALIAPWVVPAAWAVARPSMRLPLLLSAGSGLLWWFAFPPAGLFPAAFVCLVPWCVMTRRTESAFDWTVVTVGLLQCAMGAATHWLNYSTEVGWGGMLVGTVPYYLVTLVPMRLLVRGGWAFTWVLPPMWVASEFLRTQWAIAFPWVFLGHSQAGVLPLIQIADLTGALGVSVLVAAVNGLAVDILLRRAEPAADAGLRSRLPMGRAIAVAAALVGAFTYGLIRMAQISAVLTPGPPVMTVQTNIPQRVKDALGGDEQYVKDRWAYFRDHLEVTRAGAARTRPDLIVWPETSTPMPLNVELATFDVSQVDPDEGVDAESFFEQLTRLRQMMFKVGLPAFEEIAELAGGATVLVGSPGYRPVRNHAGRWEWASLNSATLIEPPPGGLKGYSKIHLVPWGEFIPGKDSFPLLYNLFVAFAPYGVPFGVEPGSRETYRPFEVAAKPSEPGGPRTTYRFATPICYESSMPEMTRFLVYDAAAGVKQVDFLVNISNDGWFEGSCELDMHNDVARFRAVEHRIPIVRSVNTGVSSFIDPVGRVTGRVTDPRTGSDRLVSGYLTERPSLCGTVSLYTRTGELFGRLTLLWALFLAAAAVWRKTQKGV